MHKIKPIYGTTADPRSKNCQACGGPVSRRDALLGRYIQGPPFGDNWGWVHDGDCWEVISAQAALEALHRRIQ